MPNTQFSSLATKAEMKGVSVAFAFLVAVASAIPEEGYNYQAPGGQGSQFPTGAGQAQYPSVPAQYAFQWDVNHEPSGNFYGHKEQREDANTQGSYYIQLPDGRRLLVEYYVDATGYHPTVTFEGEAQYPSGGNRRYGQSGQGSSQGSPSQLYGVPS
ncbi:pro-resilin-like [Penaeus monodon]|uniref:pro-resilin-like n=1 Tax=Penaeus monodon TaxID=6687 RepID=UPI0018A70D2C|nr:pro-resilin-like [Penaeus monodon]